MLLRTILLNRALELPKLFFLGYLAQSWTGHHSDYFLEHSCATDAVPLYQYTGTHFADLRRMTG